jgi:Derlin-2/3
MLLFGGALLTTIAPFVNIQFLGSSLTFMMVYVWGRRHQVREGSPWVVAG